MTSRRQFCSTLWGLSGGIVEAVAGSAATAPFRVATSAMLLGHVNENDLRAAMHSWASAVTTLVGMPIDYEGNLLCSPEQLTAAMRNRMVDGIACTGREYAAIAGFVDPQTLLVEPALARERYLILVNDQSPVRSLADLRGRGIAVYDHPTMCLALDWLQTVLSERNLGEAHKFFSSLAEKPKLTAVVLPVFFNQAEACLVTQGGFRTMCELNPQLARQLRVIGTSPQYVTSMFAFHRECSSAVRMKVWTALQELPKTPAGKQLMALFQSRGFTTMESSALQSAVDLTNATERLKTRTLRTKN